MSKQGGAKKGGRRGCPTPLAPPSQSTQSLYIDIWDYYDADYPFQLFIGGYGMGKSFSALRGAIASGKPFIYMRRTETAREECTCSKTGGDEGNPFNPINEVEGWDVGLHPISKKMSGIFRRVRDEETGLPRPAGSPIGISVALPSLAKIRGAGLARNRVIIYDEFIKEAHEPQMRGEFRALMRGYETVNRNKEFDGDEPTHLWLISNAEDIYNPIFIGLGIVSDCERMALKGQEHKYYRERGLAVHLLKSSPEFLKRKSETAIMKLMAGTQYYDVGLSNQFANNDFSQVRYQRLTGWRPYCALEHAYVYEKKGEGRLHVSYQAGVCPKYKAGGSDELLFRRRHALALWDYYVEGNLTFETLELKEFILEHIR